MKAREAEVAKKEKERKQRKEFHERHEAALIVLDHLEHELDGNVDQLCDGNLKTLLRWKGVPILKMGNMATKRVHYKKLSMAAPEVKTRRTILPHGRTMVSMN